MLDSPSLGRRLLVRVALLAMMLSLAGGWLVAPARAAAPTTLTNLAHLDFLLDEVPLAAVPGHDTYRLAAEPAVQLPWTYADARPGGTFERIGGGGPPDPVTGDYRQGAFNTDDIARAAVVYLQDWQRTADRASREKAYQLLRGVAYLQTTTGRHAGNFVLWMQPDGDLNPSAEPVELPDPSDSGASYWLARGIWAYGEGYAAFRRSDPAFAAFLQQRMRLALRALDRQVLVDYGRYRVADGERVPAWLIVNGADASAEAVLGLDAYVSATGDEPARTALRQLSEGIAALGSRDRQTWPYGAIRPWAESGSIWHAWSSQMSVALARSSQTLGRPTLLRPALTETTSLDPTLITTGGPDNGWNPTPVDRTQIAYGVDSRLQSLLAVADVTGSPGLREVAALTASWYFGTNASGTPVYDPATGVTYDGVAPDGTVNRNSGAESTIHGLLSMQALDAHPQVRDLALGSATVAARTGLPVVQGEAATATSGTVVTPASAWTGEWQWGGGAYLRLPEAGRATLALPSGLARSWAEPVVRQPAGRTVRTGWRDEARSLGVLEHRVGAQGITAVPGALLPQRLTPPVAAGSTRADGARAAGIGRPGRGDPAALAGPCGVHRHRRPDGVRPLHRAPSDLGRPRHGRGANRRHGVRRAGPDPHPGGRVGPGPGAAPGRRVRRRAGGVASVAGARCADGRQRCRRVSGGST